MIEIDEAECGGVNVSFEESYVENFTGCALMLTVIRHGDERVDVIQRSMNKHYLS